MRRPESPETEHALEDLNWNDIRLFLVLMRCNSLREASSELGVGHPTVRRRLDALESATGLSLFHRRPDGLHPTLQGEHLLDAAQQVQRAVDELSRRARAIEPDLRGPIRVTMSRPLAQMLAPDFAAFVREWREIDLQIDVGGELADLAGMQADVAIRAMSIGRTPEDELSGRKAATAWVAVYGEPDSGSWIGTGEEEDADRALKSIFPDLPVRGQIADPTARRAACEAGMGLCSLPCYMGDSTLERQGEPVPGYDLWVLVHPDLKRNPRLRVFRDAMVEALASHGRELRGEV